MAQHKLVIAEKPSVAQNLAAVIGATVRKDGYLEGNGWRVSWCVGHLAGLADADSYDPKYAKWRYDDLPILPEHWQMVVGKDKKKQGIFTDTTISLSSRLRQRPDHYTIRAGRNLPDKEFRYLRTVIVTAAVYWGFNSTLLSSMTSPLNLPAPGRCQAVYWIFRFGTALCFC